MVGSNTHARDTCSHTILDTYQGTYFGIDAASPSISWSGSDTLSLSTGGVDPSVAFDQGGNGYYQYCCSFLQQSDDTGGTWSSPLELTDSIQDDRTYMVIDRSSASAYVGNIYFAYTDFSDGNKIKLSRSTDGGTSFGSPVSLGDSLGGIGVNLALDELGSVYTVWDNGLSIGAWQAMWFCKSTDGGVSFSVPIRVSDAGCKGLRHGLKPWAIKSNGHPSIAVDTSGGQYDGRLYVVWGDVRNGPLEGPSFRMLDPDVYLRWSSDGGLQWSPPVRVNQDGFANNKDQWFPRVAVDPYGGVNILFYDSRNGPVDEYTEAFLARSTDGGQTFSDQPVSTVQFMPSTIRPGSSRWECDRSACPDDCDNINCFIPYYGYMGDYLGITSDSNFVYPCWPDTRNRHPIDVDACLYQLYVAKIPLSLQGHIVTDTTLSGSVIVAGDVIIDSGVTLTMSPGTAVKVKGFRDLQQSGQDQGKIEFVVNGTLQISSGGGDRVVIEGDASSLGQWHGVRLGAGGRIICESGLVIRDASIGLTIDSLAAADTIQNVLIVNSESSGIWCERDNVVFLKDTVLGVDEGYGIYVEACDPIIDSCVIDSCEYGVYAYSSSGTVQNTQITGGGVYGVYVKPDAGGEMGPGAVDTLTLNAVNVIGYYTGSHLYVGVDGNTRIESCSFVPESGGSDTSSYGIKAYDDAWVRMRNSEIAYWAPFGYGFYSYKSKADLGVGDKADAGGNSIHRDSLSGTRVRHYYNAQGDTLKAESNWWGTSSPSMFWFVSRVDYNPYLTSSPLGKPVVSSEGMASAPFEYGLGQNFPNPFNPSTTVEFSLEIPQRVEIKIYNILGQVVRVLADGEYTEGQHRLSWDGTDESGKSLASGIYLYRLEAGNLTEAKKMVLIK